MSPFKTTLAAALALLFLLPAPARAGGIAVHSPWIREAPPTARVLAGYMTLVNDSAAPRYIIGAMSKGFRRVEMHDMVMEGEMARMVRQNELVVPAHSKLELKPGGLHMMLINPVKRLKQGDAVMITLSFKNGEKRMIHLPVTKKPMGGMDGMHHNH